MSEPFLAEVRIFAGNFAPRGWAFCNGQLLPISQNTALFSLIGTTYGGDGRTTTALPDLQGRAPMHPGRGPGLTSRRLGQEGGVETVTLTNLQIANHTHQMQGTPRPADNDDPAADKYLGQVSGQTMYDAATGLVEMSPDTISKVGTGGAHNNLQPFLSMYFIIALVGLYPSRG